MRKQKHLPLRAALLCGTTALLAGPIAANAQTSGATPSVPNFIDARPLPQTDRGRAEELEAKRKAEEELKRLTVEADMKRRTQEDAKRAAAEADAKLRADAETQRLAAEADAKRRADEEAKRVAAEADAKRRAEVDAQRVATDAENKRRADDEAKRIAADTDAKRRIEDEAKRVAAEAEAKRVASETEARRRAEEETRRVAGEAEAKRVAAEAEARRVAESNRLAAEADAKRRADEEAKRTAAIPAGRTDAQKAESARLLVRGRQLVSEGDIVGARLMLERAAGLNDADAALALADTFEPAVLVRAGAVGVEADPALAKYWRARAQELGGGRAPPTAKPEAAATIAAATAAPTPEPAPRPTSPAAAPAPAVPAAPAATAAAATQSPEAQRYITRGRQLLQQGDIDAARLFFERAVGAGAAEGALELGATYDPVALKDLGVVGIQPDPARATTYYRLAQKMGAVGAAERLARLGTR